MRHIYRTRKLEQGIQSIVPDIPKKTEAQRKEFYALFAVFGRAKGLRDAIRKREVVSDADRGVWKGKLRYDAISLFLPYWKRFHRFLILIRNI